MHIAQRFAIVGFALTPSTISQSKRVICGGFTHAIAATQRSISSWYDLPRSLNTSIGFSAVGT